MTMKEKYYAAHKALSDLVLGIEATCYEEDWDTIPEPIFDAYAAARALLGSPVVNYPGGPEGEHFHLLRADGEECDTCGEVAEQQALLAGEAGKA